MSNNAPSSTTPVHGDAAISDPVRVEVFNQRLLAITEEMGAQLVRASFSPNIKERRDCSVALFDSQGQVIAQAAHIPIHLGSLIGGARALLARHPVHEMRPGDAFICNDAYLAGGTHLPDISVLTPVFVDDRVRFLVGCVGHHADVGGVVPGSITPDAASIFEEGVRIPPVRIAREDHLDHNVLDLIVCNTREPEDRVLDLEVQLATNRSGVDKLRELVTREGLDQTEAAIADLLRYTRRRLASGIQALPDGDYHGASYMDDDGTGGDQVPIQTHIRIRGESMQLDFSGTGAQSRGAFNVMPSGVLATVAYAVKALVDPDLPPNSGLFDGLELRVPAGSILNPHYPAAVGARTTTCQKLAGAIFAAFAELLPESRTMAGSHDVLAAMVFSGAHQRRAGTYVYLETVGGGIGARGSTDGMDAAHVHITNSLNMPAEAVELEYPLRVDEYALIPDSGGAGRYRGGLGIARQVRILENDTTFSGRADGFKTAGAGVQGGLPPGPCRVVRNHGTNQAQILDPKQRLLRLSAGESIRMETPGGAGLGEPAMRSAKALALDLLEEKVSLERALADYGETLVHAAQEHIELLRHAEQP
ncbi:MAG: hydantoinase B/oxoprolinase family protein [Gammaproteobacteria bacterium]|nr:hydantoinase B/oxoprolinase family protein [Gammaproteobacteria bacterium]